MSEATIDDLIASLVHSQDYSDDEIDVFRSLKRDNERLRADLAAANAARKEWHKVDAERIAALEAEVEALRVHEHEWSEAHAMLTGKFEIGYAMTHPEGAHTELGKAAESLNIKVAALEADLDSARAALGTKD